jgi:regulation of enolase protein 1 (concanavalin A-like superfamily)
MLAVVGVVAVLYGMALFAVLPARKDEPEPPESFAFAPAPRPTPASPPTTKTEPPPPKGKVKDEPKAVTKPEAPKKPPEPVPTQVAKADTEKPRPETPKKKGTTKKTTNPEPETPPPPPMNIKPEFWEVLSGIPGDCQFATDPVGLTINIPPTLHVLSPDLKTKNSPKLLTEVQGDFTSQVRIAGKILPGTTPIKGLPFTCQGGGLILWEDENNYLRLERASLFTAQGTKLHGVLLEVCKDGKIVANTFRDVRDTTLMLRLERRGVEARCQYSTDGKAWLDVKRQEIAMPAVIGVGVSASNASPKPFSAHFEAFELTAADSKPK